MRVRVCVCVRVRVRVCVCACVRACAYARLCQTRFSDGGNRLSGNLLTPLVRQPTYHPTYYVRVQRHATQKEGGWHEVDQVWKQVGHGQDPSCHYPCVLIVRESRAKSWSRRRCQDHVLRVANRVCSRL